MTFNSLFEMQYLAADAQKEVCKEYDPFNSLFEMRQDKLVLIPLLWLPAFNSLFEMLAYAAQGAGLRPLHLSILYLRCMVYGGRSCTRSRRLFQFSI